jgi:hypothetical protein
MLLALAAFPLEAEAQRRGPYRGPAVRPVTRQIVVVGGYGYGYGYPFYPYRGFGFGYPFGSPWGYPMGYPYGYGYGHYGYPAFDPLTSSVRLDIDQREAQVFVDGYAAGVVDEFDGVFQRLRIEPGPHEITIYLNGYRTIRRSLYLGPGTDQRIRDTMDRLGAGETSEAPPAPSAAPEVTDPDPARQPRGQQLPPRPERQLEVARASFGTVAIRVQPADADIFVDGEKWAATSAEERLSIRLTEGRHRIEVKKDGFVSYAEDVLIRRNATLTLNVSLSKGN